MLAAGEVVSAGISLSVPAVGARCRCGYRVCGGVGFGVTAAEQTKTSSPGREKPVPGLAPGNAWGRWEGGDTRGSLNVTRLGAAWSPGLAMGIWPAIAAFGGRPRCRGEPGLAAASVQGFSRDTLMTSSRVPTRMVKARGLRATTA